MTKRIISWVIEDLTALQYSQRGMLFHKRTSDLIVALHFRTTSIKELQIAAGVLPVQFSVHGLPKDEGGFVLRCYPSLIPNLPSSAYFHQLGFVAHTDILEREFRPAFSTLLQWCETHLVDSDHLKQALLKPDSWTDKVGFCARLPMEAWARGTLRVDDWPMFKC